MIRLLQKKTIILPAVLLAISMSVHAEQFQINGGEANLMGYISQGMSYGLRNAYDTQRGVNSLITTALIEGDYKPNSNLKFYGALMGVGDWIYSARRNSSRWDSHGFGDSSENLRFDSKSWQVLRELHMTVSGDRGMLRLGKQVVRWGEMDGQQVIDTINPLDQRRGFADVEFETSVIPTWLARAEYYPENKPSWLQDFGLEYVFNPNLQFIPTQPSDFGNDASGVWGPSMKPTPVGSWKTVTLPFPAPQFWVPGSVPPVVFPPGTTFGPSLTARMGSSSYNLDKPGGSDGMEHAFRIKANFGETLATFNAFYGREKLPVMRDVPGSTPVITVASDGTAIEHHAIQGYYPRKKFVGFTLATDLNSLGASSLGGVSPVLRLESLYAVNSTFSVGRTPAPGAPPVFNYEKYDMWRSGVGLDWKVKLPAINDRNYITVSPQLFLDKIISFPDSASVVLGPGNVGFEKNNWAASLMLSTAYFNDKLTPSVFVLRDITNRAYFTRLQMGYAYNNNLSFMVGGQFFGGAERNKSFQLFENKDMLFAKVTYKFQ